MTFAEKVKSDREDRGMTQGEYAELCGVSRATINRAENGKAGSHAKLTIRFATGVKEDEPAE